MTISVRQGLDVRELAVVDAIAAGASPRDAGAAAGVCERTVRRWLQRPRVAAAIEERRLDAAQASRDVAAQLAEARAVALAELAEDLPELLRELRRRAREENGPSAVRAIVELCRMAGLGVVPLAVEQEPDEPPVASTLDENSTDEEITRRYVELVGEAAAGRRR